MKKRIELCMLCLCCILSVLVWTCPLAEAVEPMTGSRGPSNVVVPNVKGIASDLAVQILQISGLTGKLQRSGRQMTVVDQNPTPGTLVASGSEIVLSLGGAATTESGVTTQVLPSETGQSQILIATPSGQVTQQSPISVMYAPKESTNVDTTLPWYPKRFLENDQNDGLSRSLILQQKGSSSEMKNIYRVKPLRLSGDEIPIILAPTRGWQYGWVPSASYGASTQSKTFSSGSSSSSRVILGGASSGYSVRIIQLPQLEWMTQSDAESVIKNNGLTLGTVRKVEDSHLRSGLVFQQSPTAGTMVSRGTSVDLWIVK